MFPESESRELQALRHIQEFINHAKELIEKITVEDLIEEGGLNPYMVAALGIDSIEDVVKLFVYKRVERSLGTSFGNIIERFLAELLGGKRGKDDPKCKSGKEAWRCWWDIIIEREIMKSGKTYKGVVLSVKSGPADLNRDIVVTFIQHAEEAKNYGFKPYLVLTYGKKAFQVADSTLKRRNLDPEEYLLVGRELFREFLSDPNYYDRVIDLIRSISRKIDIFDLIEKKIQELVENLKSLYGNDVLKLLKDLS